MVEPLTREDLKEKMDRGEDFYLINVLSSEDFEEEHIPGSINIPLEDIGEEAVERLERDDDIVVYCSSPSCEASPKAAEKLESLGFTDVKDYSGGLSDWKEKYEVESS
ncbi:MAG: rhodanese-like domain-containing protein [Candidatus Nanohaloarchaea archaeon]|nr:rhodanese-like domain-containing protein [Candidatus Nanohaloarchaea archaeon]